MTGRVVVVGLGPGDPKLVSVAVTEAIAAHPHRYVRTTRHPSAHLVEPATAFDDLYERSQAIDEVYDAIVDALVTAASRFGQVLYAVPGSPFVAERTVELLRSGGRVEMTVLPSLSFLDLAWDRIGIDPVEAGAVLVDGHSFVAASAGRQGPFLVGQCDNRLALSDIKLAVDDGPEVLVLQRLGLPDEHVFEVSWEDLDRAVVPDHLTSLWIPALGAPVAAELTRFVDLVRTLRAECPWDRSQTHQSLTRHLIEETYEVLDAISGLDADGSGYPALEEELGDLLFQVAFHATLAAEAGQFDLTDVARGIHDKLVERHPHVFGPPGHPVPNWEEQKKTEKGRSSVMEGVPANLPALLLAFKMQSKAASIGFDWKNATDAWAKIDEELAELRAALVEGSPADPEVNEELGDLLFSMVNIARHLGVDPESSLRTAANKFRSRFTAMEELARTRRVPLDDRLWDEVKTTGRK